MATTILLKRRILTARNVAKTTKAMQLIAASKLKRAQEATLGARPYVQRLTSLAKMLTLRLHNTATIPPYMKYEEGATESLLFIFSSDKGLCGALFSNLLRQFIALDKDNRVIVAMGKKIERFVAHYQKQSLIASFPFGNIIPPFDLVYPLLSLIDEYFLTKKVREVKILYNHFSNVFTQTPTIVNLLPITLEQESQQHPTFQLFEPNIADILPKLLRRYLEMNVYQYMLESYVSEQAARMIAMKNATDNAKDIIEELTLDYNKARQARITNEILDISSASNVLYA